MKGFIGKIKNGELFASVGLLLMMFVGFNYLGVNKTLEIELAESVADWMFLIAFPIFLVGLKLMLINAKSSNSTTKE